MQSAILKELTIYNTMTKIRKSAIEYFSKWNKFDSRGKNNKIKETNDLISSILFFKGDDNEFYPTDINSWKEVAINKLKYMSDKKYASDTFDDEIEQIKSIFDKYINKEVLYTQRPKITVKMYNSKIIFTNSIETRLRVSCIRAVYNKLMLWIIDKQYTNEIIFITLLRYNFNLMSINHQLAIIYDKKLRKYDVELFASPFNRTLNKFCSLYPDVDSNYKGSLGSFYKYKLESNKKYTMNPPYVDKIMTIAAQKVTDSIEDLHNVTIHITIPIWDYDSLKIMRDKLIKNGDKRANKLNFILDMDHREKYDAYEILKKGKYVTSIRSKFMFDHKYRDTLSGKELSVCNTFEIIVTKN